MILLCQCRLSCQGIPAAWLPCPLIPSCWPRYPSTTAARWQCPCLGGGWNLSAYLAARSGMGTGWWFLALPPSSALMMDLAHWHSLWGELIGTDTGMVWFSVSVMMPAAWAGAAAAVVAVPQHWFGEQRHPRCLLEWVQSRLRGQGKPRHLSLLFPPFPLAALNTVEQGGSVGVGQTPERCCD